MNAGWILYLLVSASFAALGLYLDRYMRGTFGHRRLVSAIVLQNLAAGLSLILIALLFGLPPKADFALVVWINIGVVASLIAAALYLKWFQSDKAQKIFLLCGATLLTAATAFIWHDCVAEADPATVFWLAESAFFGASIAMLIVYPRAIGKIKAAMSSRRGALIPLEALRGLCGHAAWLFFILACAFASQPFLLFR